MIKKKIFGFLLLLSILSGFQTFINKSNFLSDEEKVNVNVSTKVSPSVVSIYNGQIVRTWTNELYSVPKGSGSGFIWDTKGHIVTNYHVIQGGNNLTVSLKDDPKQYKAKLVGTVPAKDIAVIKLLEPPKGLRPITIGSSRDLQVGQNAFALGNPFERSHSMSKGIISALDRKMRGIGNIEIQGMIQTDAAINPGNSGGALVNSRGELIGMPTMILSTSGGNVGVCFAVAEKDISLIVPQLVKHGKAIKPGLGVTILQLSPQERSYYQRYYKTTLPRGAIIKHVDPNGPSAKSGLRGMHYFKDGVKLGDSIVKINDIPIENFDDLYNALFSNHFSVGDRVNVSYIRNGKKYQTKIKLIPLVEQ